MKFKENKKFIFIFLIVILICIFMFIFYFCFIKNKMVLTNEIINETENNTKIDDNSDNNQNTSDNNVVNVNNNKTNDTTNNNDTVQTNTSENIESSTENNTSKEGLTDSTKTSDSVNVSNNTVNSNSNTTNSSNNTTTSNNDYTTSNNTAPQPNMQPVTTEKTIYEKNQDLINEIQRIYGYKVSYNSESFWYGGVSSTKLTDEELANKALTQLKSASSIFPSGFFKTFQGYNGFRIELYQHIEGAAGVAYYEFGDDNYLALDVTTGFLGRVFYHETFHIMEQYIRYRSYGSSNPFDSWNSLNPSGFKYGTSGKQYTILDINASYSYDNPDIISFVSEYSKSSDREDRAELFADLMFRPYKKNYMYNGYGVNEKAKALSLIIRKYFPNSVGAKWEKNVSF